MRPSPAFSSASIKPKVIIGLTVVIAVLGAAGVSHLVSEQQAQGASERIEATGQLLVKSAARDVALLAGDDDAALEPLLARYSALPDVVRMRVFDAEGGLIARAGQPDRTGATSKLHMPPLEPSSESRGSLLSLWRPIRVYAGPRGTLNLELSLAPSRQLQTQLFWTTFLSLCTGLAGISLLARSAWQPVQTDPKYVQARDAEARKHAWVANRTRNAVVITDADGYTEWVNEAFTRLTGYTLAEVKGQKPGFLLQGPETDADTVAYIRHQLGRGEGFQVEMRNYTKSARPYWIDIEVQPIRDDAGRLVNFVAIESDITERKETLEALQASERLFRAVVESLGEGLFITGPDDVVSYANPRVEAITGYTPDEFLGHRAYEILLPKEAHAAAAARNQRRFAGVSERYEARCFHKDGRVIWLDNHATPLLDSEGRVIGTLGAFIDVTDRKQTVEELERAKDAAERANRAKSEFLSRMSHELRTPLNAILGFAQLLELDDLSADQRESVDRILKAGRHLLDLIDEVLDISRIEAGSLALSLEPVRLREVVDDSARLIGPLAAKNGVEITTSVDESAEVTADLQRLKQVLLNLLSNAVKYNRPEGRVLIGGTVEEGEDGAVFALEVRDTGPGISSRHLERLFTPFDRLGAEQTDIEGSGIGLALTKRLVEAMGGTIEVRSEVDEGTCVVVRLPLASYRLSPPTAEQEHPDQAELHEDRHLKVVYVEDNLLNVVLVEKILARVRHVDLLTAMQGQLGLELIREQRPDLVLLDLHLPGLSGDEVLGQLKAEAATRDIPVVILSADATPKQIDAVMAKGAQAYLTKPIDVQALLEVISSAFPTQVGAA